MLSWQSNNDWINFDINSNSDHGSSRGVASRIFEL